MFDRGLLSEAEFASAQRTPLVFDRTAALPESECRDMVRRLLKNARPTAPGQRPAARPHGIAPAPEPEPEPDEPEPEPEPAPAR